MYINPDFYVFFFQIIMRHICSVKTCVSSLASDLEMGSLDKNLIKLIQHKTFFVGISFPQQ